MKRKLAKCLGVIFMLVAIICLVLAGMEYYDYWKSDKDYEEIVENYTEEPENGQPDEFTIDWASLKAQNSDIVGWVRMDSGASYPIVHTTNNSFYLHKGLNKGYNRNGTIFMKAENNPQWTDPNTIIYGHNMASGSMFGGNKKYTSKSYYENHPYIYIYRDNGKCYIYRIYSVEVTNQKSTSYQTVFTGINDYQSFLNQTKAKSMYNTNTNLDATKPSITLSTCYGKQGTSKRLLIHGHLEKEVEGKTND